MEFLTNPAVLALIGTIFGGAGLKIVEKYLSKSKDKSDIATDIRNELRADLKAIREEHNLCECELDKWRHKYYVIIEENALLKKTVIDITREIDNTPPK